MANHKAAIKSVRQTKRRHTRNQRIVTNIRTLVKRVQTAVSAEKNDEAKTLLGDAVSAIDRAASKGIFHRGNASRKISRLTLKVQKGLASHKSA
ncbi:MAG TPA: 30S ribosomal protein S20 [Nitrospiria bacterium]